MTEYKEPTEDTPEIPRVGGVVEPHELVYEKGFPGDASLDV
tara:strand:+ start:147 stop:269 length:123 start_codon:yes stop_codon:yes gene_type:complete